MTDLILAKALVVVAVLATFNLARKYISASTLEIPANQYSRQELDVRFQGQQWIVGLSMVVIGIVFAFSSHTILVWANQYLAKADAPYLYAISPQSAIWWFLPGFGALALPWEITLQLWSRLGNRNNAILYNYWSSLSAGFDCRRMLRWMAFLIVLPVGILTLLELPVHAVLRQNDIRECGYAFSRCQNYRYSEANRITKIDGFRNRDGSLTKRAGIVVDFRDGRQWFSSEISDFTSTVNPALTNLLVEKTQLPLEYAQTKDDIPRTDSKSATHER